MRILFTNHHLDVRAGSELYCLELCSALKRAEHQVAIFTFQRGRISEEFVRRGVTVFSVGEGALIEAFDPEILHVHHSPCLYYLGALRLRARAIFSSLGVLPTLEAAPIVWEGVAQGLGVSEEVVDGLRATRFGAAVRLAVFRNWFDDDGLVPAAPGHPGEARRIAVVTNHLDETLASSLDALCVARPGLEWTHFGLPHNSVEITAELLRDFDRVITIGRTALLAAALQKPCLLYDVHGCDGLLTVERLDALATRNFSGRLTRSRPSREELERLLLDEARRVDVAALAERIWREYSLRRRVEELESFYARLPETGVMLGEQTRLAYGREGQVYADAFLARLYAHGLAETRARELGEAQARQRELEAELAALKSGLEAERAHTERLQEQVRQLSATLTSKDAELSHLYSTLGEIDSSLAWEVVRRFRSMKDRLIAVPGSPRRRLYDRLLQRLKERRGRG
ncbi:hypothetical protein JQX13_41245 [Archangium violaceum]|uniref:hypothetical protein n=1 Tax=Archangium violaceum TaxID=83451 RepID=UPI00193B874B|nr:hypothetical protein [Archangium violaceum]QRK06463.1 hypothetical protein JQX13_41245 [Archangium violaceum]